MKSLILAAVVFVAYSHAAPSEGVGVIIKGPSGIVTNEGPIGPAGQKAGWGGEGSWGGEGGWGGEGRWGGKGSEGGWEEGGDDGRWDGDDGRWDGGEEGGWRGEYKRVIIAPVAPVVAAVPYKLGVDNGAITGGGGVIGTSKLGAVIKGPPTAPVLVIGPSGKISADGLWGPTKNIGLTKSYY